MLRRIFRAPLKAQIAIASFIIALLCAFATQCRSADLSFEAGGAIIRGYTPSVAMTLAWPRSIGRTDWNSECGLFLNGESDRGANNFGAQCMVVDGFRRFDLGLGLAYLQNTDPFNGSHLNFSLLARWRINERWYMALHHISNAGSRMPNLGRDMLRAGFIF